MRKKRILLGIANALLTGWVPVVLLDKYSPKLQLTDIITRLLPDDPLIIYWGGIGGLHILMYFLNKTCPVNLTKTKKVLSFLHELTYSVGYSIAGIYRVAAGAFPAATYLAIQKDGFVNGWEKLTVLSLALTLGSLLLCFFVDGFSRKTELPTNYSNGYRNTVSVPILYK